MASPTGEVSSHSLPKVMKEIGDIDPTNLEMIMDDLSQAQSQLLLGLMDRPEMTHFADPSSPAFLTEKHILGKAAGSLDPTPSNHEKSHTAMGGLGNSGWPHLSKAIDKAAKAIPFYDQSALQLAKQCRILVTSYQEWVSQFEGEIQIDPDPDTSSQEELARFSMIQYGLLIAEEMLERDLARILELLNMFGDKNIQFFQQSEFLALMFTSALEYLLVRRLFARYTEESMRTSRTRLQKSIRYDRNEVSATLYSIPKQEQQGGPSEGISESGVANQMTGSSGETPQKGQGGGTTGVNSTKEERSVDGDANRLSALNTPIIEGQLLFPGIPAFISISEPQDRLMLRRCLESPNPSFGMMMPPGNLVERPDYGTMLDILNANMLPDGGSVVEARGTYRFRILERETYDGCLVSRIERIDDYDSAFEQDFEAILTSTSPDPQPTPRNSPSTAHAFSLTQTSGAHYRSQSPSGRDESREQGSSPTSLTLQEPKPLRSAIPLEPSNEELIHVCHEFYERLSSQGAPWVAQRVKMTCGAMPEDPGELSFWMASILPIDQQEKAKLLPVRSARLRLKLVVYWIGKLDKSWWASSGCIVS